KLVRRMANRMAGKLALVTAAGNGIGRATAAMLAREGAKVFAADIDEAALASIPDVMACRLDVTDREAIRRLAVDIGAIDVLFNCAGVVQSGTILQSSEEELEYALNLNVPSMYHLIRAFLPSMLAQQA